MDPNATDPIENAPFIYLGITARSKSGIMYRLKPLPVSSVALDYRALIGLAKTSGKKPCPLGYPTHRMDSLEGEMLFLCMCTNFHCPSVGLAHGLLPRRAL